MDGLAIKGLGFKADGREVLSGLSMDVRPGTIHALVGTNGTGKSTLASLIMGLYEPSGGSISFDGRDVLSMQIHERARLGITLAWQEPVRFEGISVRDYLSLNNKEGPAFPPGQCLELVGLDPERYMRRHVDGSLSGGERKRIELASVLAFGPRLAVLDEPDSGIDILSIGDIINVIQALRDSGAGVLVITHREEIVLSADVASHLCFGSIAYSGDPREASRRFRSMKCLGCMSKECDV